MRNLLLLTALTLVGCGASSVEDSKCHMEWQATSYKELYQVSMYEGGKSSGSFFTQHTQATVECAYDKEFCYNVTQGNNLVQARTCF